MAAPATLPQVAPMGPPVGVQSEPLQQRFGRGAVWGAQVSPEAQLPVVSHRQPWVPTMHVEATPSAPPPPSELAPELPLPLDDVVKELPPSALPPPSSVPEPPLPFPLPLFPHATTAVTASDAATKRELRSLAMSAQVP